MGQYYSKSTEELYTNLKTSNNGLSSFDVKRRIEKYGLNTIPRKEKDSLLKIFLGQITDPIVLLLFIAVTFSFLSGEIVDGISILVIIFIDLIIGTYEENKANKTISSLENS